MSLKIIWVDYCENGSIHGLRHVIQKDIKLWERLMWILLLVVASIAILVLVSASWEMYSYSSMEIIVDNPRYPLTKIEYPAVTICPINKIMYSRALKLLLNDFSNDTDLRTRWSNSIQTIGRMQFPHNTNLHFFLHNKSTINIPLEEISDLMKKLAPTIDDIFYKCYWRGIMYNCSDILRFQRTEEGFCYSFNSKTAERSESDSKINPPLVGPNGELIPLRNNAAGKGTGLKVVMNNMSDEFFPSDHRRRGFNVMVHTPEVLPDVSIGYKVHAARDRISRIAVSVDQVKADDSLGRHAKRDLLQCFMYNDRWWKHKGPYYKSHDEDACYTKCRVRTIHEMCNCTQYFFHLYKGLGTHCGIQHVTCLVMNDVRQRNPQVPKNEPGFPKWSIPMSMNCSCRPPCSFVSYTTELQHNDRQLTSIRSYLEYKVVLEVNYRELFATSYQRSMKYTTQDLLVSFGGVASLFLGCSLVSIVEILYVIYKSFLVIAKRRPKTNHTDISDSDTPQYPFTN